MPERLGVMIDRRLREEPFRGVSSYFYEATGGKTANHMGAQVFRIPKGHGCTPEKLKSIMAESCREHGGLEMKSEPAARKEKNGETSVFFWLRNPRTPK